MRRTAAYKNGIMLALVAVIIVAVVLSMPFGTVGIAQAASFGGKEYSELWYNDVLDIATAKQVIATWDLSKVTKPIIIACVDTGINASHEVFDGVLTRNEAGDLLGYNSYQASKGETPETVNITDESSFHGTKVAGIMAMLIRELGLQDYIKIYPIKANTPGKDTFALSSVIEAIERSSSDSVQADVINLSMAIAGTDSKTKKDSDWKTDERLLFALSNAVQKSVIVAAAHNLAKNSESDDAYYPAAHDEVIGVMGLGSNGSLYKTSNYGNAYDIVAPGENIYTATSVVGTKNNYDEFTGTSAATPLVSVAAALLKLRFIVEGKDVPSGISIEMMLANLDSDRVIKGTYSFRTLDLGKLLTQDFSSTQYNYYAPSSLSIVGNGTLGTDDYYDAFYQKADAIEGIEFIAKINPFGKTDPNLEETVEWTVKEVEYLNNAYDDEEAMLLGYKVLNEKKGGNGLSFVFTAEHGGDYIVFATLKYGEKTLEISHKVHIEYLQYYAGNVRVTTADHANDYVGDAPSEATIYSNGELLLGLTGIEYVDQNVDIIWFVNGEEVKVNGETYKGTTFNFVPTKSGTFVISAKYGNRAEINGSYTFTVVVKPAVSNPTYISLICVGGVVVIAVAVIAVYIVRKRKKVATADGASEETKE